MTPTLSTADPADVAAMWRAVDDRPGDMFVLGLLADYLEETEHPDAECVRWCCKTAREPDRRWSGGWYADWWCEGDDHEDFKSSARVAANMFDAMSVCKGCVGRYEGRDKVSAAYRDLCAAWRKVNGKE